MKLMRNAEIEEEKVYETCIRVFLSSMKRRKSRVEDSL